MNPRLIHLVQGSWKKTQRNVPWAQILEEAALPAVRMGVKDIMIRYPFGHPVQDYYWTGYWEAQRAENDRGERTMTLAWMTFEADLKVFSEHYGVTFWIYAGYMGGGAKPTDPNLMARENDPNAWRWLIDLCLTPLEKVAKVIYLDAIGNTPANNAYASFILSIATQHAMSDRTLIGVETPHPLCKHWHDMPVAQTWPNFVTSIQPRPDYPNGYRAYFGEPWCVLVNTGGPDHATQVERVTQALAIGAYAVCPFGDWTAAELEAL